MRYQIMSVLAVIGLLGACGEGRPDGTIVDGVVEITAEASVDGTPIGSAGITASLSVQVSGTMTDMFGIETSTYSWSGGPTLALPLDDAGAFVLDLTLQAGDNELVLEGTSVVGEEVSTLVLTFTRDGEAPVIQLPDETFAAFIVGEGEMDMEKQSTTFSLSGGVPLPVRDGITFSKFSSTWGPGQPNRLTWRFNLLDNHELTDARMDFRIFREEAGEEDVVVDWTPAALGNESDFAVTVGSELSERLAQEDGEFVMEVRAFDSAGLPSAPARVEWSQNLLSPPLFIEVGSEDIMGIPGSPTDPRSYVIDQNFSDIQSASTVLHVGSLLLGNPNAVPVLARLDPVGYTPLASYVTERTATAILLDLPPAALQGHQCGNQPTAYGTGECYEFSNPNRQVRRLLPGNAALTFDIYTSGGQFVSRGSIFLMAPNSEYFAIASPQFPHDTVPAGLRDAAELGPFWENVTYSPIDNFKSCGVPDFSADACARWDSSREFRYLTEYFATWDFAARIQSKVNLDPNDLTREFGLADPNVVVGYSRELAGGSSLPFGAVPTSHDSIQ